MVTDSGGRINSTDGTGTPWNYKEQFTIEIKETNKGGTLMFQRDNTTALAEFEIAKDGTK